MIRLGLRAARTLGLPFVIAVACACAAGGPTSSGRSTEPGGSTEPSRAVSPATSDPAAGDALRERLVAIDDAVASWLAATDSIAGHRAAEEARNLVVGPFGPGYGDADSDGTVEGASGTGLLPGSSGQPGLATEAGGPCVERDVLGGSWEDPAERWEILAQAIGDWAPSNNTFPALPSHPQRIVGWATLALASADLDTILGYGGHARIHSSVSLRAITACAG